MLYNWHFKVLAHHQSKHQGQINVQNVTFINFYDGNLSLMNLLIIKFLCVTLPQMHSLSSQTVSTHVRNYDNFSCVFEIVNQLLTRHSLCLALWVNGDILNWVSFLLLRYLCYEQNNTWLRGDMEFLFKRYLMSERSE